METETKQQDFEQRLSALEQAVVALTALVGKTAKSAQRNNEPNGDEPTDDANKPSGKFAALGGIERQAPHAFGLHGE